MDRNARAASKVDAEAELQRLKQMQEMQKELTDWAKSRLAWLSAVVGVLGYLGLSTVLNQSVNTLVTTLVTKPVEKNIAQLEEAKRKADDTSSELKILHVTVQRSNDDALEAARKATAAANDMNAAANDAYTKSRQAGEKLAELQASIAQSETKVAKAGERAEQLDVNTHTVIDRMSKVHQFVEGLYANQSIAEIQTAERIRTIEKAQDEIVAGLRTLLSGEPSARRHAQDFDRRLSEIDDQYRRFTATVSRRHATLVVLWVNEGDRNVASAEAAEKLLKSHGYQATVYHPLGMTEAERIADTEKDFAGLKVDGARVNPVIYLNEALADRAFYEADIRSILGPTATQAETVAARFTPAEQYVRQGDDVSFAEPNVIVFHFPASDARQESIR